MSSRKEQKEKLRREREEREAAAKAAEQRRKLIGYGAGIAVVLAAVVVGIVLLAAGGSDGGDGKTSGGGKEQVAADVLPDGGSVPEPEKTPLTRAVQQAGCELRSFKADSRDHTDDLAEKIKYESSPPTSGRHYQVPAEDGAYEVAPDVKELVHSLEHGRVLIWFKESLPKEIRANLKALYDEDPFQLIITPDETGSPYLVSATAWNRDPTPLGTGRLLGCKDMTDGVYRPSGRSATSTAATGPSRFPENLVPLTGPPNDPLRPARLQGFSQAANPHHLV